MYMTRFNDDAVSWVPELDYYIRLVQRIVESKSCLFLHSRNIFLINFELFFNKMNNLRVISEEVTRYLNNCMC